MTDDPQTLEEAAVEVVRDFPEQVAMYRKGGPMLGFLLGQVMKRIGGKPVDVGAAQDALRNELAKPGNPDD